MSSQLRSYRDLTVWQKSCDLAETVHAITRRFPQHELYGLVSQMRRAAVSVSSNIAEGAGRQGTAEYLRFVSIARGSLAELRTLVELARRFKYIGTDEAAQLDAHIDEISKMLYGLRRALQASQID